MSFLETLEKVSHYTETENGAFALSTSGNALIDAFATIGAMRMRDPSAIISKFISAYQEDRLLALKLLFYTRDVRGGLGERETFRILVTWMAGAHPEDIKTNLGLIAEYGRWDDFYSLVGTPLEHDAFAFMHEQFKTDLASYAEGKPVSLLAKWLKSENTSSQESREFGRKTRVAFGLTPKEYRQSLSKLRAASNVVEVKMSSHAWSDIDYESVPSYASKNYADAFERHDPERYGEFISNVTKGTAKINAATLFPYDLIRKYTSHTWSFYVGNNSTVLDPVVEAQWKALPDYVTDGKKFLVMADTSGSMIGLPMDTSVSLAIYFAERNTGAYHGKFITFTEKPRFFNLSDNLSLLEKTKLVLSRENVGYDTNLEAAFELVLKAAIQDHVPQSELPDAILVISDMEINMLRGGGDVTFTENMKARFEAAGYKMPTLVYWNVNARHDVFHAEATDDVRFISGSSAAIFKGLCEHLGFSARELMLNVLDSERYSKVKLPE